MANDDPASIAQSGIDPVTGSPLSSEVRKALFKSSRVSAAAFGGGGGALVRSQSIESIQSLQLARQNQQSLGALESQIQGLRTEIGNLSTGLTQIANLVSQESDLEQRRLNAQAENERRLAEQNIRLGKENDIERKIESKALQPLIPLSKKTVTLFDRIKDALMYVFLGWLTNQSIELLKAQAQGDVQKVKDIQYSILKNIGIGIATLVAVKTGFGGIIRLIGSITGRIGGLLGKIVLKPFQALRGGVGVAGAAAAARGVGAGAARAGGGVLKGAGKVLTGIGGISDLFSGQNIDAALAGLALKGPGIVKPIAGAAYGADALAEAFGGNIFGKNPNEKDQPKVTPSAGTPNPPAGKQGTPPKTPAGGESKPTATPAQSKPTTPLVESPSFSPAPLALVTPAGEEAQGTQDKSDQLDPKEIEQVIAEQKLKEKGTDTSKTLTPAQTTAPSTSSPDLGPPAKPSPNVVVAQAPSTKSTAMPPAPPPSSQSASDVPMISSANPDNFYTLYSQLNYNVVM